MRRVLQQSSSRASSGTGAALLDGTSPSGAWSAHQRLLTGYTGDLYTVATAPAVAALLDQSGAGRDFAQATPAAQPTLASVGPAALQFSGTQNMTGPLISDVATASDWWLVVACAPTVIDTGSSGNQAGNMVVGDTAEGGDLGFANNFTGFPFWDQFGAHAVQFDGSYRATPGQFTYPWNSGDEHNVFVLQLLHQGGELSFRVNLLDPTTAILGDMTALAFNLLLGGGAGGSNWFKGYVTDAFTYAGTSIPDEAQRDEIVSALMSSVGARRPVSPAVLATYPSATNTGPTGTLTPVGSGGEIDLTTDNQVYENFDVDGYLVISANNVTVRNCRITYAANAGITVASGVTGTVIQTTELDGGGVSNFGILSSSPMMVTACNIHGQENPIGPSDDTTIKDCYIHDMLNTGAPHYDGIQMDGGNSNILIQHNTIINDQGQTSCVMIDNGFGASDNITVDDNYLKGNCYLIYTDDTQGAQPLTNITLSNNLLEVASPGGYMQTYTAAPTVIGNVDVTTGQFVGP